MEYYDVLMTILMFSPLVIGAIAFFYPKLIKMLSEKNSFVLPLLFIYSFLIQLPVIFFGVWGMAERPDAGNYYLIQKINKNFGLIIVLLLIILFTWVGFKLQKYTLKNETSVSIPLLGGITLTPLLYFIIMSYLF